MADLAGNVTVTNINLTLDFSSDHTPPVLTLVYPQDGDEVCGTSFTFRGLLDDPTATVMAQIVDPSGNTNNVNGLVEIKSTVLCGSRTCLWPSERIS